MGPDDRRTKLRPFGSVAFRASPFGRRAWPVFFAASQINIIVARDTPDARRQNLPVAHLRAGMAGRAVSILLRNRFRHHHLRRCDGGKIRYTLPCSDREIRLSSLYAQELAAMNFVNKKFEVETLTAFRIR